MLSMCGIPSPTGLGLGMCQIHHSMEEHPTPTEGTVVVAHDVSTIQLPVLIYRDLVVLVHSLNSSPTHQLVPPLLRYYRPIGGSGFEFALVHWMEFAESYQ